MPNQSIEKFNPGDVGAKPAAIVFVHGFSGDRKKTWGRIPELLQKDRRLKEWDLYGFGYETHKRFDLLGLWSADPRIEEIAIKLKTTPEIGGRNYSAIAFVAHSMGGLVVQRALVTSEALRRRTSHLFLFGTPSDGLSKATSLRWLKQQIKNMDEEGDFIKQLRRDWTRLKLDTAPKFRFLAVAGETDQFVPPESSLEPFPEDVRRVIPGNHLSMLNAASVNDPCVKLLREGLTKGAAMGGPRNSARVAVETGAFQEAVDRLWPGRDRLDDGGATQLAIALDSLGRRDDAVEVLRSHKPAGTDVLGVLAGRLKRRWLVSRSAEDFKGAQELYQQGYDRATQKDPPDYDQAHYHGINLAYLALAGSDRDEPFARKMAAQVLKHVKEARKPGEEHWRLASEGDALMILDRVGEALEKHKLAAEVAANPWEMLSMEEQALRLADLRKMPKSQARKLTAIYEDDGNEGEED
jgi:pimeloyl-ACP methyl ester carboxylesterase